MKHTEIDNLPGGVLAVHKCAGMTSHDVVNRVRRLYGTKRVGHAGTLDPMATGVLVVLVGRAAKACEYISSDRKAYRAVLKLGIVTDTEDITGEVLRECAEIPSAERVIEACRSFVGQIKQIPPMYSALKVNGQKLYDLARQGVTVEREARNITVYSLSCEATERADEFILDVECSGGTYIRTLCADIGAALGCGGVMAALERREACGIGICECATLDELEAMNEEERQARLLPVERLFSELDAVRLPAFFEKLFRDGCPIYQKKIRTAFEVGARVRVCDGNGNFFALGEVVEREEGSAVKSVKIFELK
ncbi:MAG: tRNA pseudouridine(55) synthase TruB [Ruminococcaceae bacterium]|nr:tRNA pseudouridine(55) synthase TruB [Oscillospiraceae bacterium]